MCESSAGKRYKVREPHPSVKLKFTLLLLKQIISCPFSQQQPLIQSNSCQPVLESMGFTHLTKYYGNCLPKNASFNLCQVTKNKIFQIIPSLNSNKATRLYLIPCKFIKDSAQFIKSPLTHIENYPISKSKIPDDLKAARITPMYKKNTKTEAGDQ